MTPYIEPQWAPEPPTRPAGRVNVPEGTVGRPGADARRIRAAMGLDPHGLAEWMGLNPRTVQRWEKETAIPPHAEVLLCRLMAATRQHVQALTDHPGLLPSSRGYGYRLVAGRWVPEAWWERTLALAAIHNTARPV